MRVLSESVDTLSFGEVPDLDSGVATYSGQFGSSVWQWEHTMLQSMVTHINI